jgi:hypothetical protein
MSVEQAQATEVTIDDISPANPRGEQASEALVAYAVGARAAALETLSENPTREEAIKAIDMTVGTIFAKLDDDYVLTTDLGKPHGAEDTMLEALSTLYFNAVNN